MNEYDPNYVSVKQYFLVGLKCVVFNSENKLLLVKRSDKTSGAGRWSLVGGGLDQGENPIDGIKREAQEEAQIELFDEQIIDAIVVPDEEDFVVIILYQARTKDEVTLNWEHDEYQWVSKEEALALADLPKRVRSFVEKTTY